MAKEKIASQKDFFKGVISGLRTAAVRPNIHGYKPHPKQQRVHEATTHGVAVFGGNRSGKTVSGACETIWRGTGQHPFKKVPPPPVRMRAIAVDFLNGVDKIVKPEIARWMPPSAMRGGSWSDAYDSEHKTLHFENGSFIEFMSYDQDLDKFAGTSRHFIWFDEEPPQPIFNENMLRLVDTGGDWYLSMTPVEGMTWVFDEIFEKADSRDDLSVFVIDMLDNPHIGPAEAEVILGSLSKEEREARQHGKFVQLGGLIYKMFNPDEHIIEPFIPEQKFYQHFAMMDAGFNNPTAWLWGAVDKDGRVFIYDEHYESGQVVAYHAEKYHEVNKSHGFEPEYNVGDPSIRNVDPITGSSVQQEYIEHGVVIIPGNNDVRAGVLRTAGYLEGKKLYITRNCVNLLHEIPRYRWSTWATKKAIFDKNKKEEPHKKNDHACDALRYGLMSRPEFNDGTLAPPEGDAMGFPVAIPAVGLTEKHLTRGIVRSNGEVDYHMGEEY